MHRNSQPTSATSNPSDREEQASAGSATSKLSVGTSKGSEKSGGKKGAPAQPPLANESDGEEKKTLTTASAASPSKANTVSPF